MSVSNWRSRRKSSALSLSTRILSSSLNPLFFHSRKRKDDDCSLLITIPSIVVGTIADDGVHIRVPILTAHVGESLQTFNNFSSIFPDDINEPERFYNAVKGTEIFSRGSHRYARKATFSTISFSIRIFLWCVPFVLTCRFFNCSADSSNHGVRISCLALEDLQDAFLCSITARNFVVSCHRFRHPFNVRSHSSDIVLQPHFLFQRHAALLVTNNALCIMSGLVSGIWGGTYCST